MSENSNVKKHGIAFYLHKQWIGTSTGRDLHMAEVERQRKLRKPALNKKGGKRVQ